MEKNLPARLAFQASAGEPAPGNGIARNQNQLNGLRKFMLVPPETFAEQSPGAAARRCVADFFAGDDAQFGRGTLRQPVPIGDKTAEREPLSLLPEAHEIAALGEARRASQTQAVRRSGVHDAREIIPA